MTNKELNIEIAKLAGIQPIIRYRYSNGDWMETFDSEYDADWNHSEACIDWREGDKEIGEVESYEEYFEKDYCRDRDEIYAEIMEKPFSWKCNFVKILQSVMSPFNDGVVVRADWLVFAPTRQLCEAFVQACKIPTGENMNEIDSALKEGKEKWTVSEFPELRYF